MEYLLTNYLSLRLKYQFCGQHIVAASVGHAAR